MAFHVFGDNFLAKIKEFLLNFALFLFICLLIGFTNKRLQEKLSVLEEGAIKHFSRTKLWLYVFKSFFWQNLTDFLIVVFLLVFFCNRLKIECQQFLICIFRNTCNCKPLGFFSLFLMIFITLKLIVFFKKISQFFKFTVFVLYCLIVTKLYYGLLPTLCW